MFEDKILLVTGGTGSFGNAVVKRMLKDNQFKEIRILSRDEKKQDDMRKRFNDDRLKFYIGDVRDKSSLVHAVRGADYIFHAAALKQVQGHSERSRKKRLSSFRPSEKALLCPSEHRYI